MLKACSCCKKIMNKLWLFRVMRNFRTNCESCLHEWALFSEISYGEKPHQDAAQRNRDVASRHMKFQKRTLIHASMIRVLFWNFAWLWIVIIIQKKGDCRNSLLFSLWSYVSRVISFSSESLLRKFCLISRWRRRLNCFFVSLNKIYATANFCRVLLNAGLSP